MCDLIIENLKSPPMHFYVRDISDAHDIHVKQE